MHQLKTRSQRGATLTRFFSHVGLVWLAIAWPVIALASISVGAGGQASTGYPISVPPGIAGMAPNLSLSFSDGGVNGPVGVGWSLQGLSMITRCPSTRVVDSVYRNVGFTKDDKLCLDGQRLIQTGESGSTSAPMNSKGVAVAAQANDSEGLSTASPVTNGAYREFRTEKDSFARIRAYGSAGGVAGNGPAAIRVWTKSGQVYDYGMRGSDLQANITVQASSVIAVWPVHRISDVAGNYMDFFYETRNLAWGSGVAAGGATGAEWNLSEIRYTGRASAPIQAPSNKVVFEYWDREATAAPGHDRSEAYQWANKNVSVQLLKTIRTYVNAPDGAMATAVRVRTLKLEFERSPVSGRSRLTKIRDCSGADETKCLPPTVFAYRNTTAVVFEPSSSSGFAATVLPNKKLLDASAGNYGTLTGDFNGDGRTDILRWSNAESENELWLSAGSGLFTNATTTSLTSKRLFSTDGCYYSIVADFNGDGVSDILRVAKANCPGGNLLLIGSGDGGFVSTTLASLIDLEQIKATQSQVSGACTIINSAPIDAAKAQSERSKNYIPIDNFGGIPSISKVEGKQSSRDGQLTSSQSQDVSLLGRANSRLSPSNSTSPAAKRTDSSSGTDTCWNYYGSLGKRFYLLDVDGDGILDIVTTKLPNYSWNSGWGPLPSWEDRCALSVGTCTRVFRGDGAGGFSEIQTNVAYTSLYSPPGGSNRFETNPYWRLPDQADLDGDGLQDILASETGRWRSEGNGNFAASPTQNSSNICASPIDFNGDGRADCLYPNKNSTAMTQQQLQLSYGANSSGPLAQFNLTTANDRLYDTDTSGPSGRQTVGMVVEDFDGDGRQDILRWGVSSSDNGIYLSNGDGSFRSRQTAGLNSADLQAVDGSLSFVLGDFLGTGTVQILRMASNPPASGGTAANTNQLWVRGGTTGPVDVLESVTSPTGLKGVVVARVPLTSGLAADGSGYGADPRTLLMGPPAPLAPTNIISIQPAMYVIAATSRETGSGTLISRYRYEGMKVERGGRGMLGFRHMQQQDQTPDPAAAQSLLTVATDYLLTHPYLGVAWRTQSFVAALGQTAGTPLSQTLNIYCDHTSATSPDLASETAPCATAAKVVRPYLRKSVEEGRDLDGTFLLPKVTTVNTFNGYGDPLNISVTTEAALAGATRTYTKTTTNEFCNPGSTLPSGAACPNSTSNDKWILGRLTRASVTATNLLSALTASAGSSPTAGAIQGSPPVANPPPNPAALQAVLQLLLAD